MSGNPLGSDAMRFVRSRTPREPSVDAAVGIVYLYLFRMPERPRNEDTEIGEDSPFGTMCLLHEPDYFKSTTVSVVPCRLRPAIRIIVLFALQRVIICALI